jgi:hypothetical protein
MRNLEVAYSGKISGEYVFFYEASFILGKIENNSMATL